MGTWNENDIDRVIKKSNWQLGGFLLFFVIMCVAGTMDYNDRVSSANLNCELKSADYGRVPVKVCGQDSEEVPVGAR